MLAIFLGGGTFLLLNLGLIFVGLISSVTTLLSVKHTAQVRVIGRALPMMIHRLLGWTQVHTDLVSILRIELLFACVAPTMIPKLTWQHLGVF